MCEDVHDHARLDPLDGADEYPASGELTRRTFLGGLSAFAGGVLLSPYSQVAASTNSLTGARPLLAAMHVHGSWSEQEASWESYGVRGQGLVDVIFMTDHDYRALADGYWTSLVGVPFRETVSGTLRQSAATQQGGVLHLLAESASATAAASVTMAVDSVTTRIMWEKLRTSISGHTLQHSFGACRLTGGSTYEIRITLSKHPAFGTRPAGQFELWYRFGNGLASGRHLEGGGLIGVVTQSLPAAGTTATLNLQPDIRALWPDMIAADNALYLLSFVVNSPQSGAVADIQLAGMQIVRARHDAASIESSQRQIADTYGRRYGITYHPAVEIGRDVLRHLNAYSVPQFIPDQTLNDPSTIDQFYQQAVLETHARGGMVSWNHPFGANTGPLLNAADQTTARHRVFADLQAHDLYGSDVIEVGYAVRGQVDINTHMALWDTFSRHARFLTGNGVNDDHSAMNWRTLNNGFATGLWAPSVAHGDLMTALAAGRAYTGHAGKWPGGQLDMLVDGSVPMGKASVSARTTRTLDVFAANLPAGSGVQLVRGPVDYTGVDPGTAVIATIAASAFGAGGTVTKAIDTSQSGFVRAQVRSSSGEVIGIGNPVWLLREQPPGGIPPTRQA